MKVPILIPNIFDYPFTYDNNSLILGKGDYVTVPFGSTKVTGIVWNNLEKTEKKIEMVFDPCGSNGENIFCTPPTPLALPGESTHKMCFFTSREHINEF